MHFGHTVSEVGIVCAFFLTFQKIEQKGKGYFEDKFERLACKK